ncbi:sensor histidine kinase [Paenibacillus alginolyticus]|nr:sensor histidine kinase [Paenibacillus alginolyticus]MEC0146727.1 sensor histidine kinase [Paenibacillus alginolyticus]
MLHTNSNRQFISLKMKFMILFMALITIPILISGSFTYIKYSSNVERNAENYTLNLVEQIRINMDQYMKEVERLTLAPYYDSGVLAILKLHSDLYQKGVYLNVEEQQKMGLFISSLSFDRPEIESILMFANDGSLFNNSEISVMNNWIPEKENWMSKVLLEEGAFTILPPHTVYYYSSGPKQVVSLTRLIREPFSHKPLGIIKVDLSADGFEKIFSPEGKGNNINLYIYDKEGTRVYSDRIAPELNLSDPQYLSASTDSTYTGLQFWGQIPLSELEKEARELTRFTIMITVISLIVAYLLSILSSNSLVKPIRHLQSKMALVRKGFFKEQAVVRTYDEIGQLTEVFNTMVGEIDRLVREVYETKLREREAELSALQSQMNPHFLYNTLESINMMAIQSNDLNISNVVTNLGNLLRYTVDMRQTLVYLRDEMQFVESYLQIQELRSSDRLRTEIYIDPSLLTALVPKLILQPLIENVIEHGMGGDPVTIRLRARMEGEDLILSVEDDGVGMDEPTVKLVEERMYSLREEHPQKQEYGLKSHGFALRNVHHRIRLLYGESYGISIDKKVCRGVTFQIRLPFQWEE